ncbi:MAG TPA: hypothetical protein VF932_01960, partial [Anaerolineae bacterium]
RRKGLAEFAHLDRRHLKPRSPFYHKCRSVALGIESTSGANRKELGTIRILGRWELVEKF